MQVIYINPQQGQGKRDQRNLELSDGVCWWSVVALWRLCPAAPSVCGFLWKVLLGDWDKLQQKFWQNLGKAVLLHLLELCKGFFCVLMQSYRCAVFKIESLLWQALTLMEMGRMCQKHYIDAARHLQWRKKAALALWGRLDLKGMNQRQQCQGVEALGWWWWCSVWWLCWPGPEQSHQKL